MAIALPLGASMIGVGIYSLQSCTTTNGTAVIPVINSTTNVTLTESGLDQTMEDVEMHHIPTWLIVAGILVVLVPVFYYIYDAFCKPEDVKPSKFSQLNYLNGN